MFHRRYQTNYGPCSTRSWGRLPRVSDRMMATTATTTYMWWLQQKKQVVYSLASLWQCFCHRWCKSFWKRCIATYKQWEIYIFSSSITAAWFPKNSRSKTWLLYESTHLTSFCNMRASNVHVMGTGPGSPGPGSPGPGSPGLGGMHLVSGLLDTVGCFEASNESIRFHNDTISIILYSNNCAWQRLQEFTVWVLGECWERRYLRYYLQ